MRYNNLLKTEINNSGISFKKPLRQEKNKSLEKDKIEIFIPSKNNSKKLLVDSEQDISNGKYVGRRTTIRDFDIEFRPTTMEDLGEFLIAIGDAINRTAPMEIEQIFLLRLLDTLIDLKSKYHRNITYEIISFVDDLITEVSIVSSKESKKRTKNNLLFLTKLGGKLRHVGERLTW